MQRKLLITVVLSAALATSNTFAQTKNAEPTTHISTAMDHVTVLEFADPVVKVAAGSSSFQIERDAKTVMIKPLKQGVSTDLLVWTTAKRYSYELDPAGEVKNMTFAIDAPSTAAKPAAEQVKSSPDRTPVADVADFILTRAFLGAKQIDNSRLKETGPWHVRIQQILQTSDSIYLHYSVRNKGQNTIHLGALTLAELTRTQPTKVSLIGLACTQLDIQSLRSFGAVTERTLPLARTEREKDILQPGDETQGIVILREHLSSPTLLQLTVNAQAAVPVKATVVF